MLLAYKAFVVCAHEVFVGVDSVTLSGDRLSCYSGVQCIFQCIVQCSFPYIRYFDF